LNLSLHVYNTEGICVFASASNSVRTPSTLIKTCCFIPSSFLNDGNYSVTMMVVQDSALQIYVFQDIITFTVEDVEREGHWHGKWPGIVRPKLEWEIEHTILN
jgi:lipopolysaccharide transport system ATP-binding protein